MIDEMRTLHAEGEASTVLLPPKKELSEADLSLRADPNTYKETLRALQNEMATIPEKLKKSNRALMIAFEGWDAAGKGGCIRRLTDALREDRFQVFAAAAPTPEEKSRHYLWRFWRTVPPVGSIAIYDRTWYGRVLVERVENFTPQDVWERAYEEINDFERTLTVNGYILLKFWLEISPEEQLRRFEARLASPEKRKKMTEEDWRNRAHRDGYLPAISDMLALTDTSYAPWTIIPAEDKKYARLSVLRHILRALPE